tara:strand:- start:1913 stop:2686 length:774 start_codon:yes stop_codon:yes gene_type:complete
MITTAAHARERVRLILDRANSPWLTNTEINGFIEMAINEYTRERVGMFGANQKIRDDFGGFVKNIVYSSTLTTEEEIPGTDIIRRQFANFDDTGTLIGSQIMPLVFPGGEYANDGVGVGCRIKDNEQDADVEEDSINFGYLIEIKSYTVGGGGRPVKIMGLDDALTIRKDPFNRANATESEYHAVRVNDYYIVRPTNLTGYIIITYVSNNNSVDNITWLPIHGREEVCQIASRKIMGTVADERYSTGEREIKQLEGK